MGIVKLGISMSVDGYMAGPNQSLKDPLGVRGKELHAWVFGLRTFRAMQGMEGGETGPDDDVVAEFFANIGATIMGRHMFGGGTGAWDEAWRGWWGENPPYHHDVYVLTHHAHPPLVMQGGTTFHFVTDGIEAALSRARESAKGKDVNIGGGARCIRQFLAAGLVDQMELRVPPVLLGSGERVFEDTAGAQGAFERVSMLASPKVCHYRFRRKR